MAMKIYFETRDLPIQRQATLFCELANYDDYPSEAFREAIEAIADNLGLIVTESCEE
ncbi:MAG: hypothetical protein AAGG69_06760 [Pseudomonadota bacterium]